MYVDIIKDSLKKRGLSQKELASFLGWPAQDLNEALSGKRKIPLEAAVKIEQILFMEEGSIIKAQAEALAKEIASSLEPTPYIAKRKHILQLIKNNGGFWSYQGLPEKSNDDDIIEEALIHMEFEDMHLLFELWTEAHIRRVWKKRLLPQRTRLNILNTLLANVIFS